MNDLLTIREHRRMLIDYISAALEDREWVAVHLDHNLDDPPLNPVTESMLILGGHRESSPPVRLIDDLKKRDWEIYQSPTDPDVVRIRAKLTCWRCPCCNGNGCFPQDLRRAWSPDLTFRRCQQCDGSGTYRSRTEPKVCTLTDWMRSYPRPHDLIVGQRLVVTRKEKEHGETHVQGAQETARV